MHYKKSCHNCRISNDIDINLGPVTKRDERNTTTPKKYLKNLDPGCMI